MRGGGNVAGPAAELGDSWVVVRGGRLVGVAEGGAAGRYCAAMRHVLVLLVVGLVSLSAAGTAGGQGVGQKKARELVILVMPREAYERSIQQMTNQMLATLRAQGQKIADGAEQKMKDAVIDVMPYDELLTWTADIYARHFTPKELGDLLAFYRTPTGRKAARLLPDLMGEVGAKMAQILPQRLPAALKKHGVTP